MKVGILTFTGTINYGASLQAYALQELIKSFDMDVEIIEYHNSDIDNKEKNSGLKRFTPRGILKALVIGNGLKRKVDFFKKFEKNNMKFSPIYDEKNLNQLQNEYDKIVVGSDQVWCMGITNNDWHYFLDFVEDSKKKISYAPSFGNEDFPEECYAKASNLLNEFDELSVREESGSKLIKKITGRDAKVVLDPTLLLNYKQWKSKTSYVPNYKEYILVYFPHNKKKVFDFVFKLQEKTKLPIVYLSISPRVQKGVKTIYDASPEEFLGWISNASYIVTGSFHGTAFSINCGKQFYYEPSGEGSRIDNIVKMCGVEDRSIDNELNIEDKIDYQTVWGKLDKYRNDSISWLKSSLEK